MTTRAGEELPKPKTPAGWRRRTLFAAAALLVLLIGGAIALTEPFQDGATRVFGKVVDGVKDHPRATLGISLGGVALLWLVIAGLAAVQELRGGRRT
jgi:hypothetical protein